MSRGIAWALAAATALHVLACGRSDPAGEESHAQAGRAEHSAHDATPGTPAASAAPAAAAPLAGAPAGMAEVEVPFERRQLIGVRTAEIAVRPLAGDIRTVGFVAADERRVRRIQTKVEGWVEELFVNFTGERVRAGQPVLAIYSPELVASQREFLLALHSASGVDSPLGRDTLVEAARNRLQRFGVSAAQIAELEKSRTPTRRITLLSPIGGFVTFKAVLEGNYVSPEMELYTVSDLDRVWVWAQVNEDEIPLVEVGQRAVLEVPAAPGSREGTVVFLQPTLDLQTRTLRVRFDVDNRDGALRPGMYATVRIERPLGEMLALPEEAVIDSGARRVVFVEVSEGRFQPREVTLGRKGEGHYEVVEGLSPGERVVVSAQFLLDSESQLRGAGKPAHGGH